MADAIKTRKTLHLDKLVIGSTEGPHVRLESHSIEAFDRNGTRRFRVLMEGGKYPTLELCDGNGTARISATVVDKLPVPYLPRRKFYTTGRAGNG